MRWESRNRLILKWCERGELNPHGVTHWILSPARLPVPPLSHVINIKGFKGTLSNLVTVRCRDRFIDNYWREPVV